VAWHAVPAHGLAFATAAEPMPEHSRVARQVPATVRSTVCRGAWSPGIGRAAHRGSPTDARKARTLTGCGSPIAREDSVDDEGGARFLVWTLARRQGRSRSARTGESLQRKSSRPARGMLCGMTDDDSRRVDRPLTADGYRTLIKAAVDKDRRTRQHALDQLSRHEIEVVAWTLARMLVEIYRSTGSDNDQIITGAEGELAKILQLEIRRGLDEDSNSGVRE
jgi:hypothetical protein